MVKLGIRGYTITQLHKPMVWTFGLQLEILFPLSFQCSLSYIMYFLSSPLDSGSCKSRDCGFLIFHPYILAESLDDRIQVFFWGGGILMDSWLNNLCSLKPKPEFTSPVSGELEMPYCCFWSSEYYTIIYFLWAVTPQHNHLWSH